VTLPRPVIALVVNALVGAACAGQAQMPCPAIDMPAPGGAHLLPGTHIGIAYARRDDTSLGFDIFRHADAAERPTAVVLRGGTGMATVGERLSFVGQLVETLADAGYQVVLPDYRSSTPDDADADLVDLFQVLRCHGDTLGVNPDRVVIVGEDGGGDAALRLTSHLATRRRGRTARWPAPPRATVAVGATYADVPAVIEDATLLVHGGADSQPGIERPRAVCATATQGTPCDVIEVEGASHRVENWWPSQWSYRARMVEWLDSHVGPAPPAEWPDDQRLRKRIVFDADNGLMLDAYIPDGAGPFAAAILVHGGGWEAGDRVTYIAPLFRPLAARDIAWFSIDYRLTPQVDNAAQMEDVQRAVDFVRANAAAYMVDPTRLVLVGESASGQIVTHLATRGIDVAGVVSFYGVYDFLAMRGDPASPRWLGRRLFGLAQDDEAARARLRTYSPLYHVRKDMPPLLLVTGTADGLQPQAQAFATALRDVGARFDTIDLPDAPHGMEQWHADPRWAAWSGQVVDWIAGVTRR
jgi:alpha-L-fucosidase 2